MTVVIGTAGHIDHGKTTLLRALTGIDADRLPEERRRGMTIDVGYAHLTLPDGTELDFVDVPGHDRLVGNMLVGAGEIDAAMLVVAADDGPRAQTIEHLALLDALAIGNGLAVVTKADVAGAERTAEVIAAVGRLLDGTSLGGSPVIAVASIDGAGIGEVRHALVDLRERLLAAGTVPPRGSRLAIDRVFAVKGRGVVVTGTLRGGPLARGATLRLVPGERTLRVREVQVHGVTVEVAGPGRTALNLAGIEAGELGRGLVVTDDPTVVASDRLLVRLAAPLPDRARARIHLGTGAADVTIGRSGRDAIDLPDGTVAAILRLSAPLAVAAGDRAVLRRSSGDDRIVEAVVLDVAPPRGISRRRQTPERVVRLAAAVASGDPAAMEGSRLELHGVVEHGMGAERRTRVAPDVTAAVAGAVVEVVATAGETSTTLTEVRTVAIRTLRRQGTIGRIEAQAVATTLVAHLIAEGTLIREGSVVRAPGATPAPPAGPDPATLAAMDRLVASLAVAAPPSLDAAARAAGCSSAGILELEGSGRIVVLEPDLAYAASTYREITEQALALAATGPLTPAVLRDATGTSRKYVMSILADLDRRGILRRTADGHVPGPRAPSVAVRPPAAAARD